MTHKYLLSVFTLLCSQAVLAQGTGSVTAPTPAVTASAANPKFLTPIKSSKTGTVDLEALAKGGPVYFEFENSPTLTENVKKDFSRLGLSLASSKEEAHVAIKMAAVFSFDKTKTKGQKVDFGLIVEDSRQQVIDKAVDASGRAPGYEVGPLLQQLRGNLSVSMVFGAGLLDSVMSLSGGRAWFNKMVSGDSRGFCLFNCADWNLFFQNVTVATVVTDKSGKQTVLKAEASMKDERLMPEPLFRTAMREATEQLFPAATQPMAAVPAPVSASTTETPVKP